MMAKTEGKSPSGNPRRSPERESRAAARHRISGNISVRDLTVLRELEKERLWKRVKIS